MATTYLALVNKLLRRLNEVVVTADEFEDARGVQAMAKDAIVASIAEINEQEFEWPFNAATKEEVLVVGTEQYAWPDNLSTVNWNSFRIKRDDALNIKTTRLEFISEDQWHRYLRDNDEYAGSDGLRLPIYVFKGHGLKYGVSPSPNQAITVIYDYWIVPTTLVLHSDTSSIPSAYDETIIQGALYHFYMFRDNIEEAKEAERKFNLKVGRLRTMLINSDDTMQSTMVVHNRKVRTEAIE